MPQAAFQPVEGNVNLGLHPKQAFALQSPATEIMFGGAKGGGKSHLSRVAAIYWCSAIPGLQVYLFRRTFPDLIRNHMDGPSSFVALLRPLMAWGDVKFNGGKNTWDFWNGSKIHLCHCQYDKDMNDYQGAEIHVLMIDQLEQWSKAVYQFLRAQVRLGGLSVPDEFKGLFPRVLNSANPGGIGHNWVKGDFVSIAPMGKIVQMPPDEGGMKRQYILSLLEDNPTQLVNDPTYESRLAGAGSPAMVKALRWGIWDIVAGGAVDDVWNPAIHVLRPFHIPKTWRVSRAFDWGSSKPFSVGWWAVSDGCEAVLADGRRKCFPAGTRIRVAEFYGWNGKDRNVGVKMIAAEIARRIVEIEKFLPFRSQIRPGPADASIYNTDTTIAADMARVGVRWVPADKGPGSKATGLEKLRAMLLASLEVDPDTGLPVADPMSGRPMAKKTPMEEPGLFVFDTCDQFIETVPSIPRDPKKPDEADSDAEDHCLHGDTLVDTDKGQVPIKALVGTEGLVRTVGGAWAKYRNCRLTRRNQELVRVVMSDGREVICTSDHKFLLESGKWMAPEEKGFINETIYNIIPHIVDCWETEICGSLSLATPSRSLTARGTISAEIIFNMAGKGCTKWFGSSIMGHSPRDLKSTMSTMTGREIRSKTWTPGRPINTRPIMPSSMTIPNGPSLAVSGRPSGTEATKAGNGTRGNTTSIARPPFKPPLSARTALIVGKFSKGEKTNPNFAPGIASQFGGESRGLMTLRRFARSVAGNIFAANMGFNRPLVRENADGLSASKTKILRVESAGRGDVYCLEADGAHAFSVEGGIVVHNCYDETRYEIMTPYKKTVFEQATM